MSVPDEAIHRYLEALRDAVALGRYADRFEIGARSWPDEGSQRPSVDAIVLEAERRGYLGTNVDGTVWLKPKGLDAVGEGPAPPPSAPVDESPDFFDSLAGPDADRP